jgi:hypothetical protein
MKTFITKFLIIFAVSFVVTVIVTFLYSLIFHGNGIADLETAFRLAIIFAIIFPVLGLIEKKRKS